ncbi:MAG: GNAT family N-acetyltransferase [Bacillota bacterium]
MHRKSTFEHELQVGMLSRVVIHPTPSGEVSVHGPITAEELEEMSLDPGLKAFRPADRQLKALINIATMPEGRVFVASRDDLIVGYVTFHLPGELERWGQASIPFLLEMGGLEISPRWRTYGIAGAILQYAFCDMEGWIVFSTEYAWHWDLEGSGLNVWEYKDKLRNLLSKVGLVCCTTDDPEICYHPANMLTVRYGSQVDKDSICLFECLRHKDKWMF